jgi:hypothetical protein
MSPDHHYTIMARHRRARLDRFAKRRSVVLVDSPSCGYNDNDSNM